jgi:gliding motility-associated-like protein
VLPGNAIAYTPGYNFIGTDLFQYRVCSKSGECAEASVFINVLDYNFQPNLSNDTLILINGTKDLRLNILENDLDIYDEPITVTLLGQLSNGTAVLNDDNTLTPTFKQFFYGMDSLQYSICDIDNQCDTAWVFLDVKSKFDKNKIFVPTGISPNGDGLNDHFFIPELKKYPQCEITIFTQWGQVVYTDTDYNNNWDGRSNTGSYNGDLLPTGTYYYVIIVTGSDLKIAGFIYLSR